MKKSLIALAVLGVFASGAQAQTSVSLYGVVDLGISHIDTGAGNALGVTSGTQSSSRLGFRGTEDLGGGLSAFFTLESGFNANTGAFSDATRFFGRQSFVGLRGGFGAIKLGRQETPIYAAYNQSVDPFARGLLGDITRMFPIATTTANTATSRHASTTRSDNTINYSLPKLGGLYGEAAYTLGGVTGDSRAGSQIGLMLGYKAGPFNVVYAHHNANNSPTAPALMITGKSNFLAGTYDFGVAKAYLAWGNNDNNANATAISRTHTRTWMAGLSKKLGVHNFMANYTRKQDMVIANADANQIALAYTYDLSKRTNFYVAFAHTENESAGRTNVTVTGADNKSLAAGIRHRF